LGIPLYLIMIFGYKLWAKVAKQPLEGKGVRPTEADFYTGKAAIDAEEEEYLANRAAQGKNENRGKFYKKYIGWLL
jgi:amino acid transporter